MGRLSGMRNSHSAGISHNHFTPKKVRWVAEDQTHRAGLQDHYERRPSFRGLFAGRDGIESPMQNVSE
jgi:hypothetical protein